MLERLSVKVGGFAKYFTAILLTSQVCNHRKYVPKYEIQFAGKAYHRNSLEEVEQDDSSDDDDDGASKDSQKRSVNADGQVIPSEERCWLSGQYCKANAEQAHSLIHVCIPNLSFFLARANYILVEIRSQSMGSG